MKIRLLGPIAVSDHSGAIDLGPRKQRALLTLLALNANNVVSTDRILEDLWGPDAMDKEKALWVLVSRLRSALEPDRDRSGDSTILITRDQGYVLQIDAMDLDITQFESAVDAARDADPGDPATITNTCDEALELWRGAPGGEFAAEDFVQRDATRLEELRLEVEELRAGAAIRLGQGRGQIATLQRLHADHPLRERFVELLMRALYQGGQQADTLRVLARHRAVIGEELGIDPDPALLRLEEQILLHDPAMAPGGAAPVAVEEPATSRPVTADAVPAVDSSDNPYKGLRAFREDDAADFHGRTRLIADILDRIDEPGGIVSVVGPSGSGKSSVVRAGVVPALRDGALDGSERWVIAQMVPGAHPFAEMEAALHRATPDSLGSIREQLLWDDAGLLTTALRMLPNEDARLVLVIDQFEELFTLVDDDDVRRRFLTLLTTAAEDPRGRVRIVLTLRADFYDRPLQFPAFGELVSDGLVSVTRLSTEELEAAAAEPAARVGVTFAPGLLAQVITDVGQQTGALPLFQFTLTELFDRRVDDVMSSAAYREVGGVSGALGRRAEEVFRSLGSVEQDVAQQLFLRLATITEAETSRRRVAAAELISLELDVIVLQGVIEQFGRERLLSFDMDHESGAPTVEVAHEALLDVWGRLGSWIEGHRSDLRRLGSLRAARSEWIAAERDPDYLLRGSRLREFEGWSETAPVALTATERELIVVSADREAADAESESARQRAEVRRLRRLLMVTAIGLVLAIVAGTVAIIERGRANDRTAEANAQAALAQARGLAATAVSRAEQNPAVALVLAAEATGLIVPPPIETLGALFDVRQSLGGGEWTTTGRPPVDLPQSVNTVMLSADGQLLVIGGGNRLSERITTNVFWTSTGSLVGEPLPTPEALALAGSSDGELLAVGGANGAVELWQLASGRRVWGEDDAHTGAVFAVAFSPDNRRLATGDSAGVVRQWDLETFTSIEPEFDLGSRLVRTLEYSPDGTMLAIGGGWANTPGGNLLPDQGENGEVRAVISETGEVVSAVGIPGLVIDVTWSPDGSQLATASALENGTGSISLHDVRQSQGFTRILPLRGAHAVEYSTDGSTIVAAGSDAVRTWVVGTGQVASSLDVSSAGDIDAWAIRAVDDRVIAVGATTLTAQVWIRSLVEDLGVAVEPASAAVTGLAFGRSGSELAVADRDGRLRIVDVITGGEIRTLISQPVDLVDVATTPDRGILAVLDRAGVLTILDLDTGEERSVALGIAGRAVALSRNGSLVAVATAESIVQLHTDTLGEAEDPWLFLEVATSASGREIITGADFSADGVLGGSSASGSVVIAGPTDGFDDPFIDASAHISGGTDIAFAPTGTDFATTGADGAILLWNQISGQPRIHLRVFHPGGAEEVVFTDSGDILITGGKDGSIRLWDARTGGTLGDPLDAHDTAVISLAVSADGTRFASGARDGSIHVWDLFDPAAACALTEASVELQDVEDDLAGIEPTVCTHLLD